MNQSVTQILEAAVNDKTRLVLTFSSLAYPTHIFGLEGQGYVDKENDEFMLYVTRNAIHQFKVPVDQIKEVYKMRKRQRIKVWPKLN